MSSTNRLFKSVSIVSGMTGLSRVLGFVRDMVCAQFFGAAAGFDAFLVAFKIPNFLRRLFAEGAFSQAFVPVLTDYQQNKSPVEVDAFINHMLGSFLVAITSAAALITLLSPWVVHVFAPGFVYHHPGQLGQTAHMLRFTAWYLPLISLTALVAAILNCHRHFAVPAAAPILLNLSLIVAVWWLAPQLNHANYALAWAIPVAGALQLGLVLLKLRQFRRWPLPKIAWRDPGVRRVIKLMLGALFAVSVSQINLMLDTFLASFLPIGSISWLYYSDRLMNFPLGVFAVAISTVILPYLSKVAVTTRQADYQRGVAWALSAVFWVALPAAVGLGIMARPLLTTLFQYGQFSQHDVMMAGRSLAAFALGVPAFMSVKVMVSIFYAKQDVRTPVRIAVRAMLLNILFNVVFFVPLAHAGLALATTLAAWAQVGMLGWALVKRNWLVLTDVERRLLRQIGLAAAAMAVVLWLINPSLQQWFEWPTSQRVLVLLGILLLAKAVYFLGMCCQGWRVQQLMHFVEYCDD